MKYKYTVNCKICYIYVLIDIAFIAAITDKINEYIYMTTYRHVLFFYILK